MVSLHEHLQTQHGTLPGPVRRQPWRGAALASFAARGFPTRRDELWHYTDLRTLERERFTFVAEAPSEQTRAAAAAVLAARGVELDGPRLVFVDGYLDPGLSRASAADGVEIRPLPDAWGALVPEGAHPLATLNAAFAEHGAVVKIAPRARVCAPIHFIFVGAGREGVAAQPRIVVELGPHASATIVQHFADAPEAAPGWLNLVTDVVAAAGAELVLYRLQEQGAAQFHTSLLRARLARDARLTAGYVDSGGKLVRNDVDVTLAEPGAHAELFGIVLAAGEQHIDNHLRVDHVAPRTTSVEAFRAIVDDKAHAVFSGKVVVRPGAQKIDARQSSDNLLLSAKAEADTRPELEIYADDVKCSHGATVGELDEAQLFYLRSRGLTEDAARALLTFAFAHVSLERIGLAPLRELAVREIARRLPEGIEWERTP